MKRNLKRNLSTDTYSLKESEKGKSIWDTCKFLIGEKGDTIAGYAACIKCKQKCI